MLNVLFLAAFPADAEKLKHVSEAIWSLDYVLDNKDVLSRLEQTAYDILLFDFEAGSVFPLDIINAVCKNYSSLPIFLLSRQHCHFIEQKVCAAEKIAGSFPIPYDFNLLVKALNIALYDYGKKQRALFLMEHDPLYTQLQGKSTKMQEVRNFIMDAAEQTAHVLLYGESGSGKEVVASLIHHYSKHRTGNYMAVNTTCITEELAESLLFGSVKGAYTGAVEKDGLFAQADCGTLFFDEIENLTLNLQGKLLRIIETREYYKLGGNKKHYSDFRLICATNQDLQDMVNRGAFRLDLFYRLDVLHLVLPPLRKHKEDIAYLSRHYLRAVRKTLSRDALDLLYNYSWPGNVRELFNCLQRAAFLARTSPVIQTYHIDL